MPMRLTGLMSGLDTDSVIQELVMAKRTKVDNAKKAQTKLEWKTDVWKSLNSKLKSFQSKLNNLRFTGDYMKKTTKVSNSNVVSVLTGDTAMNSVQTLRVSKMAKTAYLTGGKMSGNVTALTNMQNLGLKSTKASLTGGEVKLGDGSTTATGTDTMSDLGIVDGTTFTVTRGDGTVTDFEVKANETIEEFAARFKEETGLTTTFANGKFSISAFGSGSAADFNITSSDAEALGKLGLDTENGATKVDGKDATATFTVTKGDGTTVDITVGERSTISDLMNQLKDAGLNVNFDATQKRLFISAQDSGEAADFTISAAEGDEDSQMILSALGLASAPTNVSEADKDKYATKVDGQDAEIYLNGARFTSKTNTFEVNGLTITALAESDEEITLTTEVDTDGIYDMIKDFIKSYSELVNEMDKLYNADSAKDYEPLTSEEKESMSESEIEEWEKKIKDSLLRRDEDVYAVNSELQKLMMQGVKVNGKTMYLSDFGINTMSYFEAAENERHAYHINGDEDDENTSDKVNELKQMIASDPDTVVSFFTQLTQSLYSRMNDLSKSVEGYRTFGNFYDDKKMKSDYDDYTSKIKDLEKKLTAYEDKWYNKFAQMESAMAKLQNSATSITSLLGG